MNPTSEPDPAVAAEADDTLARHLDRLAADADDIVAMLGRQHGAGGDLHPEALGRAEHLTTSLRKVAHALGDKPHLAAGADDLWRTLSRDHEKGRGFIR